MSPSLMHINDHRAVVQYEIILPDLGVIVYLLALRKSQHIHK